MNHIQNLQELLEKKLEQDWEEKWSSFGSYDTNKFNRRSKFYDTLSSEISEKSGIKISRDTIQRFDKGEGGNSKHTLDSVSKYLDFDSFDDFTASQSKSQQAFNYKWLAVLVVPLLTYLYLKKYYILPEKEKQAIIEQIKISNNEQFKAFQNLDTLKLNTYYTSYGSAKKGICTVIELARQNNRWISQPTNNPSCFKILHSKVLEHTDSTALVKTEEQWFLKWYDLDEERYTVSYDKRNTQYYELIKEKERWKIHNNFYEGKASRIDY